MILTAEITCVPLMDPENGTLTYSTGMSTNQKFAFRTRAMYDFMCNDGYELNGGDLMRSCVGDGSNPVGSWNGTTPRCSGNWNCFGLLQFVSSKLFCYYFIIIIAICTDFLLVCRTCCNVLKPSLLPTAQSVYLSLRGGKYFTNNSEIIVTQVGSDDNNLVCHTDLQKCCRGMDHPTRTMGSGQWIFPDRMPVPKESSSTNAFVFSRGPRVLHLIRKGNVKSPLGTYCCNIPDSRSESNIFCANLVGKIFLNCW